VNYSPDQSLRWTLISLGITLVALGIALHMFRSGESLEQKIERIEVLDKKLDEVLKRISGDHQS
jgi:sulfite exporter TauE/SafE